MNESAAHPTAEHLAGLRRAREGGLIAQFCDGKVLGDVEMAEIAHILPPQVLADPPPPVLKHDAEAYAAQLGTSKRTVFRWLELGRRNKDHCPLDQPGEMLGWWARNMSHKVPSYLADWIGAAKPSPVSTVSSASNSSPAGKGAQGEGSKGHSPDRASIDMRTVAGHGLDTAVHILRQNVEVAATMMADALKDPNDQRLAHYQSRFDDAVEQLRKAEVSLLALQKARGDLAPRSEFRSDLITIMLALRGMIRRRADSVCSTLANTLAPEQLGMVRAALIVEAERDEKQLRTSKFWQVGADGALQLPAA